MPESKAAQTLREAIKTADKLVQDVKRGMGKLRELSQELKKKDDNEQERS